MSLPTPKKRKTLSVTETVAEQERIAKFNKAIFRQLLDEAQDG